MNEICFVIPGANEIGAKLTRWIIIIDYANLIVMDASAGAFLSLNASIIMHGVPRETAGEIFVSRNNARISYKCTQRMIFAAVSTSLWAVLLCIST